MSERNTHLAQLLLRYAAAFERSDATAMVDCFELPYTVVRERDSVAVTERDRALCETSEQLAWLQLHGFTRAPFFVRGLSEHSPQLASVCVRWALQRADKTVLADFEHTYLVRGTGERMRFVGIIDASEGPLALKR